MMRFAGKHGIVHEVNDHRHQPQAHLQALPGTARADAVPVRQRRRRAEAGHFRRRQRLYPGSDRRRLHRQAFPHLERERHRLRAAAEEGRATRGSRSRPLSNRSPKRSATRRRSAASPMSTPSCSTRSRRRRATRWTGMDRPRGAQAAVFAPKSRCWSSSRAPASGEARKAAGCARLDCCTASAAISVAACSIAGQRRGGDQLGREGVQSLIDWLSPTAPELPIGLAVAAAIVLFMLGLRFGGPWLVRRPRLPPLARCHRPGAPEDVDLLHGRRRARHRGELRRRARENRATCSTSSSPSDSPSRARSGRAS